MTTDSYTLLGQFDDGDYRWCVRRCSTPAGNWIELRTYELDGEDDEFSMTGVTTIPDAVAWRIAEKMMANVEMPLAGGITNDFTIGSDAMRVLKTVRKHDLLAFMLALRDIYRSREKTGAVIGQLATIALSSMAEVLDDTGIDQLIAGWMQDSDDFVDIDDALITKLLDSDKRGNDD
jgi:hypothetical protein